MNNVLFPHPKKELVNWRNIAYFLGLTFGLTWLVNLILWQTGFESGASAVQLLQFQMLLPAFSAIVLGMFVFKGSQIYYKSFHERSRLFFYFYMIFTLIFAVLIVVALAAPDLTLMLSALSGGLNILGLVILVVIRIYSGKETFNQAGLSFGKTIQWITWGLAFVFFYALQTALNALFNLGGPADPGTLLAGATGVDSTGLSNTTLRILLFFQTVLLGPFLGILLGFGEEYGWRGYLQSELIKLGRIRGVMLLGLIWGVWHYPVIWMGHNYPGQPILVVRQS